MFQLSNTCEIEHLEMLAQSFSANVSTNLSKISKCCWELQTEQVVPALAGKEKRKRRHRIRTYGEKKLVGDSEMHRETYGRCASDVWDGNTVSCFCFVSSYLLWHWPKLCAHHKRGSFFQNMRQMISEGNLRFLALPPTPTTMSILWLTAGNSSDGECGCYSTSLAQHFHLDWADRLKPWMR